MGNGGDNGDDNDDDDDDNCDGDGRTFLCLLSLVTMFFTDSFLSSLRLSFALYLPLPLPPTTQMFLSFSS